MTFGPSKQGRKSNQLLASLLAHKKLAAPAFAAYAWPADLADEEILARLLGLNLERGEEGGD